jgi:hypothetical protein
MVQMPNYHFALNDQLEPRKNRLPLYYLPQLTLFVFYTVYSSD